MFSLVTCAPCWYQSRNTLTEGVVTRTPAARAWSNYQVLKVQAYQIPLPSTTMPTYTYFRFGHFLKESSVDRFGQLLETSAETPYKSHWPNTLLVSIIRLSVWEEKYQSEQYAWLIQHIVRGLSTEWIGFNMVSRYWPSCIPRLKAMFNSLPYPVLGVVLMVFLGCLVCSENTLVHRCVRINDTCHLTSIFSLIEFTTKSARSMFALSGVLHNNTRDTLGNRDIPRSDRLFKPLSRMMHNTVRIRRSRTKVVWIPCLSLQYKWIDFRLMLYQQKTRLWRDVRRNYHGKSLRHRWLFWRCHYFYESRGFRMCWWLLYGKNHGCNSAASVFLNWCPAGEGTMLSNACLFSPSTAAY